MELSDVITLNGELAQMNREKELSFVIKYKLVKLLEQTTSIVKKFNQTKLELFKKFGNEDPKIPGNFNLGDPKTNKNYEKGMDELKKLIEVEEEFNGFEFKLKDFAELKTSVSYVQFFKFLKE